MTVEEIAREIKVSKVCIRRHLELLKRDGLVEFAIEKHERGRPVHVYSLTDKSLLLFSSASVSIAVELLRQVRAIYGQRGIANIFRGQADDLIASLKPELEALCFEAKVERLFDHMDNRGFDITIGELGDGSYSIRQKRCPLVAVASKYGQVCEQEARVYSQLLGADVVRDCCIADGASSCDYRIITPRLSRLRGMEQNASHIGNADITH
jgi:predicted ArsR family transcriptional regulator